MEVSFFSKASESKFLDSKKICLYTPMIFLEMKSKKSV